MLYIRFSSIIICVLFLHSILIAQPTQFALYQNVPNPFDSSGTTIYFKNSIPVHVNLWVEDTLGTHVISLVSQQTDTGFHSVEWNARNQNGNLITPGNYFCKMTASTFRDSIIMQYQDVLSVNEVNSNVETFSLLQNYPNPFNPITTIQFSIPFEDYVTLKVFGLLGEEVATLVSQRFLPGTYSVQWDAGNASDGIYVYRLQSGKFSQSKKLILLR